MSAQIEIECSGHMMGITDCNDCPMTKTCSWSPNYDPDYKEAAS